MPACPACGAESLEGSRVCGRCGRPLDTRAATQVRKTVTVLFADVCGSTALGERLDPETLRGVMARYFDAARTVIEGHDGTVEKFIGDAVVAVFGVPVIHEDDALRAVRAAVGIRRALAALDRELETRWSVRLEARFGIDTGEVVAGDPSSGESFVSGDAANVAARLEQVAEPGEILIGAATLRLVRDAVRVEPTGPLSLRGKAGAVEAFRILDVIVGAPAFDRRMDSPMVDRDAELRQLLEAFERTVRRPGCELVSLLGEAGVGKSRLIDELRSRLPSGSLVLAGRCLPYGEGITFWPVSEMVKQAAGIEERDSPAEARTRIGRLLEGEDDGAIVGDRVAAAIGLGEAQGVIQETFWAVRRLLESLADERPLVAVFDDIHWAEPTLLDLVEYLARFSQARPLLLLCAARPEIRETRPDWGRIGTVLSLGPLDADESARLLLNLVGQARLPRQVHDRVLDAAEGNPLFVEEMLRMLVDDGVLRRQDGHWSTGDDLSIGSAPRTVQAIIAARLDRLLDEERAVMQRASVVGRVFYWGAIDALSPAADRVAVGGNLQALLRKELIEPEPSPFAGEDAFRFSHSLVRDAAYDSIPKRARAELHQRCADWLERIAGGRLAEYEELVGYHLEQAHRYLVEVDPLRDRAGTLARRAAERLAAAGRRSYGRGDQRAAVGLLSRAAELLPPDDRARLRLLPQLGAALTEAGRLDQARDVLDEALERSRAAGDLRIESAALFRWIVVWTHSDPKASFEAGLSRAEAAIAMLGEDDHPELSEGWRVVGMLRFWHGEAALSGVALERALDHARRAGDRRQELEVQRWQVMGLLAGPQPAPSALEQLSSMESRLAPTERTALFHVARIRSELEAMEGRFDAARESVATAKRLADELGLEFEYAGGVLRHSGYIEYLAGDLDRAAAEMREACARLERLGDSGHLASVAPDLAEVLYAQDRMDEALSLAELARSIAADDDVDGHVRWRRVEAKVLARRGDAEEARRLADEAVELAGGSDYLDLRAHATLARAIVLRLTGDDADAATSAREAAALFAQKGNVVMAGRASALLEQLARPEASVAD